MLKKPRGFIQQHICFTLLFRKPLGDSVEQRGSNTTAERLRFDFPKKVNKEELMRLERIVNEAIDQILRLNAKR